MCRSRRELSNAYLLAKFGFDAAENEPSKVARWTECSLYGIEALAAGMQGAGRAGHGAAQDAGGVRRAGVGFAGLPVSDLEKKMLK